MACIATIEDKQAEAGLLEACLRKGWEICFVSREQISRVKEIPTPSIYPLQALGVWGVAEPAALAISGALQLLVVKQKFPNVTVAVAMKEGQV